MEIPKDIKDDIWNYCRANDITNIDEFTLKLIKQGLTAEKYGSTPIPPIKETIVEKIVEVPVDKIVEVIKEVQVEKEVYITDDKQTKELTKKMKKLQDESNSSKKKIDALQKKLDETLEELKVEKNKKKRDLYGE